MVKWEFKRQINIQWLFIFYCASYCFTQINTLSVYCRDGFTLVSISIEMLFTVPAVHIPIAALNYFTALCRAGHTSMLQVPGILKCVLNTFYFYELLESIRNFICITYTIPWVSMASIDLKYNLVDRQVLSGAFSIVFVFVRMVWFAHMQGKKIKADPKTVS